MLQVENVNNKDMPEWLKKCLRCTHAYMTKDEDIEIKCRCKNGCNFKESKKTDN